MGAYHGGLCCRWGGNSCLERGREAVSLPAPILNPTDDKVTIAPSTITWETYAYAIGEDGGIVPGSFDGLTTMTQVFDTWVLENQTH